MQVRPNIKELDDLTLLRAYASTCAQEEFEELVHRHIDFVFSTALRKVNGDAHLAQDVTQQVFADLSSKAHALFRHPSLPAWLHTSTRYVAANAVRSESRRRHRERESQFMQEYEPNSPLVSGDWESVRPLIDEALSEMHERDRGAIILRFFEGKPYAEVGMQMAITANAARMRTERALDKLRSLLSKRGITSTSEALAITLSVHAVTAAPVGLASAISAGTIGTGALLSHTAGISIMSSTKVYLGVAAGVIVLGTTGIILQHKQADALHGELRRISAASALQGPIDVISINPRMMQTSTVNAADVDAELAKLEDETTRLQKAIETKISADPNRKSELVFPLEQVEKKPRISSFVQPEYPDLMRRDGIEGEVVVAFVVNSKGEADKIRVLSSTRQEFESATIKAVESWRFIPGERSGQRVSTGELQQAVKFKVGGQAKEPAAWF
jgi:RNA polymerase sigma factor (sigma-70 family)